MQSLSNIAIVGTGNVAFHITKACVQLPTITVTNYGRNTSKVEQLASQFDNNFGQINDLSKASHDLILIAVADNAINKVSKLVPAKALVVHCSGATPMQSINTINKGVFYPLQTMSKGKPVNFSEVPILIESNSKENLTLLEDFAKQFSGKVYRMTSEQRLKIHLAAVFACNFSNFMMASAQRYLEQEQIPFELLHTLITETAEKALLIGPKNAQTGPAIRGDEKVLQLHEQLLNSEAELLNLYQSISNLIKKQHGIL